MPARKGSGAGRATANFYIVLTLTLKMPDQMDQICCLEGLSYITGLLHDKTQEVWCKSIEMKRLMPACTQKG